MIKYQMYWALLLLFGSCTDRSSESFFQHQNSSAMQKQEIKKIEAVLEQYQRALNSSDAVLAQSLYTEAGIFMPTEAPSAVGSENILQSYQYIFSQIQLNIEFFIEEVKVENKLAFATTSSKGTTLIHASGATIPEANRELFVFEKMEEEWKIARYMFNKTSTQK